MMLMTVSSFFSLGDSALRQIIWAAESTVITLADWSVVHFVLSLAFTYF
jgi:hypothetical protein